MDSVKTWDKPGKYTSRRANGGVFVDREPVIEKKICNGKIGIIVHTLLCLRMYVHVTCHESQSDTRVICVTFCAYVPMLVMNLSGDFHWCKDVGSLC